MEERLALYKKRYGKAVRSESQTKSPEPLKKTATEAPAEKIPVEREDSAQNSGGILGKLQNLFSTRKE
ncbi:MAG: hypothetical protein PHT55_03125, partial [Spirochaetales bacterium]|nr:hypothetical protein [Spirochaetales bacterium]